MQAPIDSTDGPMSQLEPYFCYAALYDTNRGCKVSEDFHFDLNNPMVRNLLPKPKKEGDPAAARDARSLPLALAGVPEEWIAHPKQAVMNVTRPHCGRRSVAGELL